MARILGRLFAISGIWKWPPWPTTADGCMLMAMRNSRYTRVKVAQWCRQYTCTPNKAIANSEEITTIKYKFVSSVFLRDEAWSHKNGQTDLGFYFGRYFTQAWLQRRIQWDMGIPRSPQKSLIIKDKGLIFGNKGYSLILCTFDDELFWSKNFEFHPSFGAQF